MMRATPPPRQRGTSSGLGTVLFVIAAIFAIFTIGIGGLGMLLYFVLDLAWPLAAPAILLYVVGVCLPAALVIWKRHQSGAPSQRLRLPGPLPIAAGAVAA